MKTNFILLLLATIFTTKLGAQNRAFIVSPNYVKNILLPEIVSLPTYTPATTDPEMGYFANFKAKKSQNIQVNNDGEIMFFIVDAHVYDRKGKFLGIINGNTDGITGETMIVPAPGCVTNNIYFLVTSYQADFDQLIHAYASYDKITIEYDANDNLIPGTGLESVLMGQNFNPTDYQFNDANMVGSLFTAGEVASGGGHGSNPKFAASKVIDGSKRYVYCWNAPYLFRFKIENNQFSYDNYALNCHDLFQQPNSALTSIHRQELELVTLANGDLRIALPVLPSLTFTESIGFTIIDLDPNTGDFIPNSTKFAIYDNINPNDNAAQIFIKGVEFSPDGQKIYFSHNATTQHPSTVDVFVLNTNTKSVVSTLQAFKDSQIESAKNGNNDILIIPSSSQLYQITNPNGTPTVQNFQSLTNYIATSPFVNSTNPVDFVRLLQDQIDGEDYTIGSNNAFAVNQFTVNASGNWSPGSNPFNNTMSDIYVKESIVVPAGFNVNISGMTFYFAKDARFIIENAPTSTGQGARVIASNCTFDAKDLCFENLIWRGIEVRGKSNFIQGNMSSSAQGRLQLRNSKVAHAILGVTALAYNKVTSPGGSVTFSALSARSGGIVQTFGSTFYNNQTDVYLQSYANPNNTSNVSAFDDSKFVTDDNFLSLPMALNYHIWLNGVKGVFVKGCDFVNDNPDAFNNYRGVGIFSRNSIFYVDKRCSSNLSNCIPDDPNFFENLTFGIYTSDIGTAEFAYRVNGNIFHNNWVGIRSQNNKKGSIINNGFEILRADQSTQTAGVYLQNCDGYKVENNLFTYDPSTVVPLSQTNTYGVVCDNSLTNNNEIYRNTFDGLKIGGQSERVNGSLLIPGSPTTAVTGLQWVCNNFKSTRDHDLSVVNGLISYQQGYIGGSSLSDSYNRSVRNIFSSVGENPSLDHDIIQSNATQRIAYVHLADAQQTPDSYTIDFPSQVPGVIPFQQTFGGFPLFSEGNVCIAKNTKKMATIKEELEKNKANLEDAKIRLDKADFKSEEFNVVSNEYNYFNSLLTESHNDIARSYLQDTVDNTEAYFEFIKTNYDSLVFNRLYFEFIMEKGDDTATNELLNNLGLTYEYKLYASMLMKLKNEENITEFIQNDPTLLADLDYLINQTKDEETATFARALYEIAFNKMFEYEFLQIAGEKSMKIPTSNTDSKIKLIVYPNPVKNKLSINLALEENETVSATIFSVLGNTMGTWKLSNENNGIDVNHFQGGVYLIHVINAQGENIQTLRFVKQ